MTSCTAWKASLRLDPATASTALDRYRVPTWCGLADATRRIQREKRRGSTARPGRRREKEPTCLLCISTRGSASCPCPCAAPGCKAPPPCACP
eukprot:scaffold12821_cov92-Isochrysis_galbana.AAC.1